MVSRSVLKPDKGKNADFRLKQIWRLDIVHHDWLSYSREGNVLHSSRQSAFACLLFNKVEEVQHIIVIPSDSHSGINYPPTFVDPPFLSRRELRFVFFLLEKL